MESLYNQHLLEFLSNQSETSQKCYRHIENLHLLFCREKVIFDKITAFLDFEILQFLAKTLWKVFFSTLTTILRYQSEPLEKCFRHIEALHLL